jgi:hypothetical protein
MVIARTEDLERGVKEAKATSGDEIMSSLIQLADYAEAVSEQATGKLNKVCLPANPKETEQVKEPLNEMPEMFRDMREHIQAIGANLDIIKNTLDRVDI